MSRTSQEELYDDRSLLVKMKDLSTEVSDLSDEVETLETAVEGKQDKLTSANAGQNVTITEEGGVTKINAISEIEYGVSHGIYSVEGDIRLDPSKIPTVVKSVETTSISSTDATLTVKAYDTDADTEVSNEVTVPSADLTNDTAGLYNKSIHDDIQQQITSIEEELGAEGEAGTIRGDIAVNKQAIIDEGTTRANADSALQTAIDGKSKVEWTQEQTTGTEIAKLKIDGGTEISVKAPAGGGGSTVAWSQEVTTGTKIAEITIDSATTEVYAPTAGGGGTITEVKMNGSTVATSGVADLGTVITAHQSLADYEKNADLDTDVGTLGYTKNAGTITEVQVGGTSVATSGVANIVPETDISTSKTGVPQTGAVATAIAGKSKVEWTQVQTSGTEIAQISIDGGTAISVMAPAGSGGTTRTITTKSSMADLITAMTGTQQGMEVLISYAYNSSDSSQIHNLHGVKCAYGQYYSGSGYVLVGSNYYPIVGIIATGAASIAGKVQYINGTTLEEMEIITSQWTSTFSGAVITYS